MVSNGLHESAGDGLVGLQTGGLAEAGLRCRLIMSFSSCQNRAPPYRGYDSPRSIATGVPPSASPINRLAIGSSSATASGVISSIRPWIFWPQSLIGAMPAHPRAAPATHSGKAGRRYRSLSLRSPGKGRLDLPGACRWIARQEYLFVARGI